MDASEANERDEASEQSASPASPGASHARGQAARFALALVAVAAGAGCFLYPSPEDSWSDAYGLAAPDADGAVQPDADGSPEARSGPCARAAPGCAKCCDDTFNDLPTGSQFFKAVFSTCACPRKLCQRCGLDCAFAPESSDPCSACLAGTARSCASAGIEETCPPGSRCHDYALCIAGCQP